MATLGRLYAKKETTTALYQWVLVTEAAGYNLYTKLTTDQKCNACDFIKKPLTTCPSVKESTHFFDRDHIVPIACDTERFALRWCRCLHPRNVWDEDEYAQQIGRNASPVWRKGLISAFLSIVRAYHCSLAPTEERFTPCSSWRDSGTVP